MTFVTILKCGSTTVYSLRTQSGKIVRRKVSERQEGIWSNFCSSHPHLKVAQDCLNNINPYYFWSLANQYPDLVKRLHTQVRLMCNFGFNGGTHGNVTPTVLIVIFASTLLTIIVTSYLIARASKTTLPFHAWHKLKVKVRDLILFMEA